VLNVWTPATNVLHAIFLRSLFTCEKFASSGQLNQQEGRMKEILAEQEERKYE
jgi:hypothetical protein